MHDARSHRPEYEALPAWERLPSPWEAYALEGWAPSPDAVATREREILTSVGFTDMATTESTRLLFFAFAYVLARIAAGRREMSVLDFGGNVGSYALVARSALPDVEFRYTVQELPAICAAARRVRPWVRFVSADAELADAYDLVVSSGSLQYIEDWRGLVPRLAARASPWLYLARLPIVLEAPSFPVRQSLGRAGDAMFWCINRRELLDALPGVTLVHEFRIADGFSPIAGTPEMPSVRSYLFRTSPPFTG